MKLSETKVKLLESLNIDKPDKEKEELVEEAMEMMWREKDGEDPSYEEVVDHLPVSYWWMYEEEWDESFINR